MNRLTDNFLVFKYIYLRDRKKLSGIMSGFGKLSGLSGEVSGNEVGFGCNGVHHVDFGGHDLLDHTHDTIDKTMTRITVMQENF